jgi:adenylosuccinate synthase
LRFKIKENNEVLKAFGAKPLSFKNVHETYRAAGDRLKPFVTNTVVFLYEAIVNQASILFEGAQGTFLDIDHGTYPFVTSSNTTAGGACTGSGVPPNRMGRIVGVMKAYTTRVGEGPLPTENQEISDLLHGLGREFGATTGRPRRCGWFDAVATSHATMVNGIDELAVTNLDGLDTLDAIKVCVGYRDGSKRYDYIPNDLEVFSRCQPVYKEFPGWKNADAPRFQMERPSWKAKNYLRAIRGVDRRETQNCVGGPGACGNHFRLRMITGWGIRCVFGVAQTCNLSQNCILLRLGNNQCGSNFRTPCRLQIGDTAD